MRAPYLPLAVFVSLNGACLSDSTIAPDAVVTCASNAECPRGYVCEAGRCEDADGNRPPRIVLEPIARSADAIEFDATVFDANGDLVDVDATIIDGSETLDVTISPATVDAKAEGTRATFSIAAPALAEGALPRALTVVVTVSDDAREGSAEGSVLYGNEAPQLLVVTADASSTRADTIGGLVTLRMLVRDSSADPVSITRFVVVRENGDEIDVPLDVDRFPDSALTDLSTSEEGNEIVLGWNSGLDAPFAEPIRVRIEVADEFGGASSLESEPLALDNAPLVDITALAPDGVRALSLLAISAKLDDPNSATGDELIDISLELLDGDGNGVPLTLTSDSVAANLDAVGLAHTIAWDITADAPAIGGTVRETTLAPEGALHAIAQSVTLRLRATDPRGLVGEALFDVLIGDDPPVAELAPIPGVHGGDVPITFALSDSTGDPSSVEIEFRPEPGDVFRPIAIKAGLVDALFVGDAASTFLVLWDSLAELNDDTTVPQGIGRRVLPNATLRIRASDEIVAGDRHFSAWTEIPISLSNQSAPRLEPILVADQGGVRSGVVPIVYRLVDEESDAVNVVFEHSVDGESFVRCTEAPVPQSEGVLGLASAPASSGGVVHTFMWDSNADLFAFSPSVRLRARIVDPFIDPEGDVPTFLLLQPAPFDPVPAGGDDGAFTKVVSAAPSGIVGLAHGDVNGDNHEDLVVVANGNLEVRTGDGFGNFATTLARFDNGYSDLVDLIDIDGDGDLDIFFGLTAEILRGPTFADTNEILVPCDFCFARAADIDNDGAIDIVRREGGGGSDTFLRFAFGSGSGAGYTLTDSPGALLVDGGAVPIVIDVDGDGHQDLLVGQPLRAYRGSGGVADAAFTEIAGSALGNFSFRGGIADVDGDGLDDIALNDDTGGLLIIFRSRGDGTFEVEDATPSVTFSSGVITADLNGDAVPDFAATTATEESVLVALTRGDGRVLGTQRLDVADVNFGLTAADFDRNGKDDLAVGVGLGFPASTIQTFFSGITPPPTADAVAEARRVLPSGIAHGGPTLADVNRDGIVDFIMTNEFGATLTIARGVSADGGLVPTRWIVSYGDPDDFHGSPVPAFALDLNADGVVDYLRSGCQRQVWLGVADQDGVATGEFVPAPSQPSVCIDELAVGDFNGDGAPDFAARGTNNVQFFFGVGDGTFSELLDPPLGNVGFAAGVAAADFDVDGFTDVIVTEDRSNGGNPAARGNVTTYRGGAGGLTLSTTFDMPVGGGVLRAADLDADGKPDVLAVPSIFNSVGFDIQALRSTATPGGALTFASVATGTTMPQGQTNQVTLVDVDLDGALDAAFTMAAPFDTSIFLFPGSRAGDRPVPALEEPVELDSIRNLSQVIAADVTADGAPDMLSTDFIGGATSLFAGRPSLPFTSVARAVDALGTNDGRAGVTAFGDDVFYREEAGGPFSDVAAVSVRRIAGAADALAGLARSGSFAQDGDLLTALRVRRVVVGPARPLTGAFYVGGDQRLVHDGERIALVDRFGPRLDPTSTTDFRRAGLDLASGRGLIVDLPFLAGRLPQGNVRVLIGVPRWRVASEVASDARSAEPGSDRLLPRIDRQDGSGERDVVDVDYEFVEATRVGDLATGSGIRFTLDVQNRRVRVLTDALGVMQVFDGT